MQWISQHSDTITALTSLGTLVIWGVYLQVFVSSYRRGLRATLLITRGPGVGLDAKCLLSNMSTGSIYISSVQANIEASSGTIIRPVTDATDLSPSDSWGGQTRQGPLGAGETRDIGSFRQIIAYAARGHIADDLAAGVTGSLRSVAIEVVGIYGSENLPIGAIRHFALLERDQQVIVQGSELETTQIRRRRDRRRLVQELERDR